MNHKSSINVNDLSKRMAQFFIQMSKFCIEKLKVDVHKQESLKKEDELVVNQEDVKVEESSASFSQSVILNAQKIEALPTKSVLEEIQKPRKPQFLLKKPKVPTSSYLIFLHHNKSDISERYNTTSVKEIAKLSSIQWKNLTSQQKQKYYALSKIEKQRYQKQIGEYNEVYKEELSKYKKDKQAYYRKRYKYRKEENKKNQKEKINNNQKGAIQSEESELSQQYEINSANYKENKQK